MLEARAFVPEITTAKRILDREAVFRGEYICWDSIYVSTDSTKTLKDEFLRLRVNKKNIWNEKDVVLVIKQTEQKNIGKKSIIPFRKEFDTKGEAEYYINENLHDSFIFDFEFTRTGWQYDLNKDQVDIEKVEDLNDCYTIEIKSETEEGLHELVKIFNIKSTIQGPTVVEIKKLLQKSM